MVDEAAPGSVPPIPRTAYPREFGSDRYPVAVLDLQFRFVATNPMFQRDLGVAADELCGTLLSQLWDFDPDEHRERVAERLAAVGVFDIDVNPAAARPTIPAATLQVLAITDQAGALLGYSISPTTEQAKIEKRKVSLDAEGFQLSFDQLAVGMVITGTDGYAIKWNPAMGRLLGRSFEEIAETDVISMVHPDHRARSIELGLQLITGEIDGYSQETRLLDGDGVGVWLHETATCVWDGDGNALHFISQFVDIRDRKQAEEERNRALEALLESQAKIRFLFDGTPVPIVEIDASLTICAANEALSRLLGRDPIGMSITEVVHPDDMIRLAEEGAAVETDADWIIDIRVTGADGTERLVRSHGRMHHDEHGAFRSATATWTDITDAKEREDRLWAQASTDPLTGLPHRATFLDRLHETVAGAATTTSLAVLFVDLDQFKPINDSYGHEAGDHLLCQVARRLRSCVRSSDMVARLGGDEFVVMIDVSDSDVDPAAAGERIVDRLARPFVTTYGNLSIAASVGLAYGGIGSQPRDIVHRADLAAYQAKAAGGSRLALAEPV